MLTGKKDNIMKAKYQKGGRKIERVQNRKDAKENRKKFKKFGTPLNKKSINSFRQKGGFSSAGIGTSYEREKRFENREKQKPDLNPPQYYEYKDGKKTIRYKDGDTYTQPPSGTTYKINRGDNTESSEMPVDRRKGGKRYQKGGKKVKSSLQYKPGFPATGNKPSPYNLKTLQKAINRDSTKVADRGMIGDFFDPGVTSGSTGPSDQYNLQINREFRDKETGSSSKQTAKKINTMKNKKQSGGDVVERNKRPISNKGKGKGVVKNNNNSRKMTGQEVKDLGKTQLRAGRRNRRTAKGMRGEYALKAMAKDQRQAGRALKKKGRQMKRSERRTKAEAEVKRTQNWLQTGGSKEITFGAPRKKPSKRSKDVKDTLKYLEKNIADTPKEAALAIDIADDKGKNIAKGGKNYRFGATSSEKAQEILHRKKQREGKRPGSILGNLKNKQKGGLKTPTAKQKGLKKLPTSVRNKMGFKMMGGKMKYGMGGKKNKKFLGGLAGAIGGMKDGGGIGGALKGALGGGMLGRTVGAVKGAMGGGGLKGAMAGLKGGAFGNSNPMGGGGQPAAAQDPAMQDPAAQQMAQRGGARRRNRKAKNAYKKSTNRRGKTKNKGIKLGRTGTRNCIKGDC
tara:strand:- start:2721 stop:4589 length:1869 start_codon:yes stop_codon:yes gene_type:complete